MGVVEQPATAGRPRLTRSKRGVEHLEEEDDIQIVSVKRAKESRHGRLAHKEDEEAWETPMAKKSAKRAKNTRNQPKEAEEASEDLPVTRGTQKPEVSEGASKKSKMKKAVAEEKRLKRYREKVPQSYLAIHHRAMTQRMFVIERTRSGTEDCPEETVQLAGTTGNIYTVQISQVPACNCPHAKKGHQCKHVVYVLCRVLRAPEHLQYQLALLTSELREIFALAPPILTEANTGKDGHRKAVEDDCPICCTEFEPDKEHIVWCKAACGNNMHEECFKQWAATKAGSSGGVTCPFCRTPWIGDEDTVKRVAKSGKRNAEGYVNVGGELGLPTVRDFSTYHTRWVRRQTRGGVDVGNWVDPDNDW